MVALLIFLTSHFRKHLVPLILWCRVLGRELCSGPLQTKAGEEKGNPRSSQTHSVAQASGCWGIVVRSLFFPSSAQAHLTSSDSEFLALRIRSGRGHHQRYCDDELPAAVRVPRPSTVDRCVTHRVEGHGGCSGSFAR